VAIIYVYAADLWCEDCGRDIRNTLIEMGKAPQNPDDQSSYDSDDFPIEISSDEETDCPYHCGAGEECFNAEVMPDGQKIGAWLENPLTSYGIKQLEQQIREEPENVVVQFWSEHYADCLTVTTWTVHATSEIYDALEEILDRVAGEEGFEDLKERIYFVKKALLYY